MLLLCQWVCKDTWRSNAEPLRAAMGWPTRQPWWDGHTRTHGRRVRVSSGPHSRVEEIGWALIPESLQKDRMLVGTGKKICIASTYFPQNNHQVRNLYFLFLLSLHWKISGFWIWWTLWVFFYKINTFLKDKNICFPSCFCSQPSSPLLLLQEITPHLLISIKTECLFLKCKYRKDDYIFMSFPSLPLARKCNMTLKHPDMAGGDKPSEESPAVSNIWKQEAHGVPHELTLPKEGGGGGVHLTWQEQRGGRPEPSPAVTGPRKGDNFTARAAFGWHDMCWYWVTELIQSLACVPALCLHV